MARRNSNASGCLIFFILAAIVGGCNQLFKGDDDEAVAAQSVGPTAVPALIGKQVSTAEDQLESLGLDVDAIGIGNSSCYTDVDCTIYRIKPAVGAIVDPGETIEVWFYTRAQLSWYRKHKTMPNLVGMSEKRAKKLLEPIEDATDSDSKEVTSLPVGVDDRVISQSPKAGTRIKFGRGIKFVVGFNYGWSGSGSGGGGDGDDGSVNWPNFGRDRGWF
ncbi:PASTA domain-containing protein [Acrocarpospora macrocephala]|nr:PASTA domain-containing protein [Acrocarpospora macrocephala]